MLGMDFILAIAEDHVPSTHARDPCMHVFLDAGAGNVLAFSSPRTDQRQAAFHAAWMHQKEFTGSA